MQTNVIVNSLGIGGIIFLVLLMVWFIAVYMKRRVGPEQFQSAASDQQKICWEEKRRQPRVAVSWPAKIGDGPQAVDAQVKDVSLGGAFVVCEPPLALKSRLQITLRPEDRQPLSLNAEVVWSNANVPAEKIINRGMGVRFIQNQDIDRERLKEMISACFEL